jgi:membrane protein DedA with SNARE-associated domain
MSVDSIVHLILQYRYLILIPLTFIEGPIIGFITGALSRLGYFDPFVAFWIFIIRDILVDGLCYFLGRWGGNTRLAQRFLKKVGVTQDHLKDVRKLWDLHPFRTMTISKLSYGIAQAFLMMSGMVGMPFNKFFRYALIVAFVEYGGLFIGGYLLGGAFGSFTGILSNLQWVVAILALVVSGYYIIGHFMRRKLQVEQKEVAKE